MPSLEWRVPSRGLRGVLPAGRPLLVPRPVVFQETARSDKAEVRAAEEAVLHFARCLSLTKCRSTWLSEALRGGAGAAFLTAQLGLGGPREPLGLRPLPRPGEHAGGFGVR